MLACEAAATKVLNVTILVTPQGRGVPKTILFNLIESGKQNVQHVEYGEMRHTLKQSLKVPGNPAIDLLLFCLPRVDRQDQFPLLLPEGKEVLLTKEISAYVYEDTHTLRLGAMIMWKPGLCKRCLDSLPPAAEVGGRGPNEVSYVFF